MTEELVVWLRGVLDEVECRAKAASGPTGVWEWTCGHRGLLVDDEYPTPADHSPDCAKLDNDEITIYDEGGHSPEQIRHIATHDPAAVLADVAAKRKLIELHEDDSTSEAPPYWFGLYLALSAVATAYKDWPGYKEEWSV